MRGAPPDTWSAVPDAVYAAVAHAKRAADDYTLPGLPQAADVLGWRAGPLNAHWGGPRPLTNTLVGAGLGALLGYGTGLAAEQLAPAGTFRERAPAARLALLGGLLGGAPGVLQGVHNAAHGLPPWATWWALRGPDTAKQAADLFAPVIDRGAFTRAVYQDPYTPPPLQAAAAGLVNAASAVRASPVVTPWDVARVAVGAGSGLASGYLVGKTLGVLAGLSPERQHDIQRAGVWAGLLKATVPPALGLR